MIRKASAQWSGSLKEGNGTMKLGSGAFEGAYSFPSRFESGPGTNPEELIGAAHAGCYSMALSAGLGKAGFTPEHIATQAEVEIGKDATGFAIQVIRLHSQAKVPGIGEAQFQEIAAATKDGCPVSKALKAVTIELDAKLV